MLNEQVDRGLMFGFSTEALLLYVSETDKKRENKTVIHQKPEEKDEQYIRCGQCENKITSPDHRIEIDGCFEHTFMNPDGHVFRIGCFGSADGCLIYGDAKGDWTWFQGFWWRIALCRQCLSHLGWSYESEKGNHFFGLILDALV